MWDDQDLAEKTLTCKDKKIEEINHSKGSEQTCSPLTCVGENTLWMKLNKYPHPLKNLGEEITAMKLNIHPHPLKCVGDKTSRVKINKYPHPPQEIGKRSKGGGSTFKSIHILKCFSHVLVVFYKFSLVQSAFVADIQFVQQYLAQLKVSTSLPHIVQE